MTIDDAEWHQETVAELGLDESAAAVHIGIYLAWAGDRGLLAPEHQSTVLAAQQRIATPSEHAHTYFVAQFGGWDLTATGRRFTEATYDRCGDTIASTPSDAPYSTAYSVPDSWSSYDAVVPVLDELLARWKAEKQ